MSSKIMKVKPQFLVTILFIFALRFAILLPFYLLLR